MKKILIAILLVALTLFAVTGCQAKTYTVTFDTDGGSAVNAETVTDGETATKPAAPTKEGYTFAGWFVGEDEYDFASAVTADVTVKAKWTINEYTVSFDADGGSVVDSLTVKHGEAAAKPADPTKEGYTFAGWFAGDAAYVFDTAVTADVALKAKWTINEYTVIFDADNGSEATSETVEYGAVATKPADPVKEGYTFAGWFAGDAAYVFDTAVTANVTLKAKWTINEYTVIFDADNGSEATSETVEYGAVATKPADPTKDGYAFLGWFAGDVAYDFATPVTGNVTITAKWVAVYTVTFDPANGGETFTASANDGTVVTAPEAPVKKGFAFAGWFAGETAFDFATPITSDITLTAKWELDLPDLSDLAGKWEGKEQISVMGYTQTVYYYFTIEADGKITATYEQQTEVEMIINYVVYEDGVLTINYHTSTNPDAAEMIFTVSEDKGKLTAAAGVLTTPFSLCKEFTVTFEWGNYGGTSSTDPKVEKVLYGETVKKPTAKSWTGYEIKAWKDAAGVAFDFDTPITSDMTLTAEWGIKTFTVAFYKQDGTVLKELTVNYGETIAEADIPTEGVITSEGSKWNGIWYTSATSNSAVNLTAEIKANKTFYPGIQNDLAPIDGTWKDENGKWVITINAASSTVTASKDGTEVTVNWFRFQELSNKTQFVINYTGASTTYTAFTYADGTLSTYSDTLYKEGDTVWAVTFNTDGGSAVEPQKIMGGALATKPEDPTKSGYTFIGWFVGETEFDFTAPITADVEVVAKWAASYTVTFDSAKGSAVDPQSVTPGAAATKPEDPTRSGYVFMGWFVGEVEYDFSAAVNADITLTAKWGRTVKFWNQAKTECVEIVVEYGKTIPEDKIPAAQVDEGFTFTGVWHKSVSTNQHTAGAFDFSAAIKSNTEIVPGFVKNTIVDFEGDWNATVGADNTYSTYFTEGTVVDINIEVDDSYNVVITFKTNGNAWTVDTVQFSGERINIKAKQPGKTSQTTINIDVIDGSLVIYLSSTKSIPLTKGGATDGPADDPVAGPTLADLAGTWTGAETAYGMSFDYEIVINADGTGSAKYSSGGYVTEIILDKYEIADGKLVLSYFNYEGDTAASTFKFTLTDGKLVGYGMMGGDLILEKQAGGATAGPSLADYAGTWTGAETAYGMSFDYEIVINADGTGSAKYSSGGYVTEIILDKYEIADGKLVLSYFNYADDTVASTLKFTLTDGKLVGYGMMGGDLTLTKG